MVYVFLAEGFEEIEALAPIDILKRGGVEVRTVGVNGKTIKGSHNISIITDITTEDINLDDIEAVVLPGGMPGTLNLEKNDVVINTVKYCYEKNLLIGAICAAPSILGHLGMLNGKKATSFPDFQKELIGANLDNEYVSNDGMIVTARGMGVSTEFGLKLLEILKNIDVAEKVKGSIQCK